MSFLPKKNVLVPVDFSDTSAPAVRTAQELSSGSVHVIYVNPSLNPVSPLAVWGDEEAEQRCAETAHQYLKSWLQEHGIDSVRTAVPIGQPAEEILRYADSHEIDLVVIPAHGHTRLAQALLGSVVDRVVRCASVPVLVLHKQSS